jgi:hypothetical protein
MTFSDPVLVMSMLIIKGIGSFVRKYLRIFFLFLCVADGDLFIGELINPVTLCVAVPSQGINLHWSLSLPILCNGRH